MQPHRDRSAWARHLRGPLAALLACATCSSWAAVPDSAVALRGQYARLGEQLQHNPFGQPVVLQSSETPTGLTGDMYAVVAYPLNTVSTGLRSPDHWCDVMILHINTKYCRATVGPTGTTLSVRVGKKTPQSLTDATAVEFRYRETGAAPDYFAITLSAQDGPMGTSDYQIQLAAVELPGGKSFLHFTYSYSVALAGRIAMQAYLATAGAGKVGFTQMPQGANGQPDFVAGVRGVVERNTMRYFLAIDSYLAAQSAAPAAQQDKRLQAWFTAVERYPRQLHEMDRPAYLEMKRAEVARQQAVP